MSFFIALFKFTAEVNSKYRAFPYTSCSHPSPLPTQLFQLSTPHTRVGHLLPFWWTYQLNLHWYLTIIQVLSFTSWFTLGFVYSVGFDKSIMTCIYYHGSIQNSFTALNSLCALPIYLSFPSTPGNCWSLYFVHMNLLFQL